MVYLHKYETFKLALEKLERCKVSKKLKNHQNPTVRNKWLGFFIEQMIYGAKSDVNHRPKAGCEITPLF